MVTDSNDWQQLTKRMLYVIPIDRVAQSSPLPLRFSKGLILFQRVYVGDRQGKRILGVKAYTPGNALHH